MDTLGRVPEEGDRFEWEGYSFEVVDMDDRRVDKVLAIPTNEAGTSQENS
jgi:putative hemolysin